MAASLYNKFKILGLDLFYNGLCLLIKFLKVDCLKKEKGLYVFNIVGMSSVGTL